MQLMERQSTQQQESLNTQEVGYRFIEDCKLRELSPKTIVGYVSHIKALVRASSEFPPTPDMVQHLLASVKGGKHNADSHYRTYNALGNYAEREYGIPNFMHKVVRPRVPKQIMPTITNTELNQLAMVLNSAPSRDKAIIALFVDTAIRNGEAVNLKRKDILEDRIIITGKTGSRVAPLSPVTRELLLALPVYEDGYVFHGTDSHKNTPLGLTGLYKVVRKYLLKIGYQGKQFGSQTLRRSFGRFHLLDGGDMQSLSLILGHKNITTTANYYAPLLDEDVIKIHHQHTPGRVFGDIASLKEQCNARELNARIKH